MKIRNLDNKPFYFLLSILTLVISILILLSLNLQGEVINEDTPARGIINLKMTGRWQAAEAEGNPFGSIRAILASADGRLCVMDDKLNRLFLFDPEGKFIKGFGKPGEGPGEIKLFRQAGLFNAGDRIAIQDTDRIHYFNWEGDYIESRPNTRAGIPVLFLSRYEFITAPRNILDAPEGIAEVKRVDLQTGKENVITKFSMFKGGAIQNSNSRAAMVAVGLTPLFEMCRLGNRLYYAVSDRYHIEFSDMQEKISGAFDLKRKKKKISEKEKVDPILERARGMAPEELLRTLAQKLPDEEVYFTDLQSHNGLIYALNSAWTGGNDRKFDVFSPEGKYLYKMIIEPDEGDSISGFPLISGNDLFLVVQNEDDEFLIKKYNIQLPR